MESSLQVQVVNIRQLSGKGAKGKAYDFQVLDVVVGLPDGTSRVAEVFVDGDQKIEAGKRYELQFAPAINQEKKITWRVSGVRALAAVKAA